MVIEAERLLLREMTENDFETLYKVLADSDIMQHYPYTFDDARVRGWIAFCGSRQSSDERNSRTIFGVLYKVFLPMSKVYFSH